MLNLTKSERRALIIISGLMLTSLIIQWLRPTVGNTEIYDYSKQDSLFEVLSADTIEREVVKFDQKKGGSSKASRRPKVLPKNKSINLNTATQAELQNLPRIGPATAKLIIVYRTENGPFKTINELDNVKRIGPKTIEKIEPFVYVKNDSLK